ncbi:hypothetical protein BSNK01_25900 [Bacillaceae bacterium]
MEPNLKAQGERKQLVEEKKRLFDMIRELEKKTAQVRQQHIRADERIQLVQAHRSERHQQDGQPNEASLLLLLVHG